MAVRITIEAAITACDALVALPDIGSGDGGTLVIYAGTRPETANTAVTDQDALVEFDLPNPAFGSAVSTAQGGHATANSISPSTADETGTATWFRIFDADGDPCFDGDVTDTQGSGDLQLSSTAIVNGIDVTVVSLTATMPTG